MKHPAPIRRLGILGDIHTEETLLARALAHLTASGVDAIVSVGDLVDGPGELDRCIALLEGHGVLGVRGNHERWLLAGTARDLPDATPVEALTEDARTFLAALPVERTLETPGGPLLLCHGLGTNDMACLFPDDYGYGLENNTALWKVVARGEHRFVVHGHTHRRMVRAIDGVTFINGGTLHRDDGPGFARVDFDTRSVAFFDLPPEGPVLAAGTVPLP